MKPIPSTLVNLLLSSQQLLVAELYTFQFADGSLDHFTNIDMDLIISGVTYKSKSIRIEGLRFKLAVGFQIDEQDVKIAAYPFETLGGANFFTAVESGLLDGATITRQRAFWQPVDGRPFVDYQNTPAGVVTLFIGLVSTINKIGRSMVEMKLKSPMKLLDIDMPRNTYQPSCQWTLYDQGCTLTRATFTSSFTVSTANTSVIDPVGGIPTPVGADGVSSYYQGLLVFTSGVNNNIQTVVRDNDGTSFFLQYPLRVAPGVGDTFSVSLGCAKTSDTCNLKFNNLNNFRGFPRVPPVVVSL